MTRRTFTACCGALAGSGSVPATAAVPPPHSGPQLFVDDALVASAEGLTRTAHRPEKYLANPLITRTEPWERNCISAAGSVLFDEAEQLFKCWYQTYDQPRMAQEGVRICYATSKDGIYWQKPKLGIVSVDGSKQNNVVMVISKGYPTPIVLDDPRDPDRGRRYKMILYWSASEAKRGIYGAISGDGTNWKLLPGPLIHSGDRASFFWNPVRKKYAVMTRPGFLSGPPVPAPGTGVLRWVGLWESDDFQNYGPMQPVLWPDEADGRGTEFYSMQPFQYGSHSLGYLEMFYAGEADPRHRRLNTQLTASMDGVRWQRALGRKVFLEYGPLGSWDGGWVCPTSNAPIRVKDKLWIFYQGRQTMHWGTQPYTFVQNGETYELNDARVGHIGAIGVAFLRPDGFASMDAGAEGGRLTTKPVQIASARELRINARAQGFVRVGLLDADGRAIAGFSPDDCQPFQGDSLDHVVRWSGKERGLDALKGKMVQVRFDMRMASLYSYRVE